MREIRLSPSAINDYQHCPLSYLYGYIYGLSPEREKDAFRIGRHWGKCHEIIGMVPQSRCPSCLKREEIRPDCYLCAGTGVLPADLMDAVVRYLNWVYENVPDGKTHEQWEVERITLLYSFSGYRWHYPDSLFEVMGSEIKYDLPVVDPRTNRKMTKSRSVGRVDHLIRIKDSGLYYVLERKSTSQSLTTNRYWNYLQRNVQTVDYLWATRIYQRLGHLESVGIKKDDPLIEGVFYDVWHKPDIAPRRLYKKELAEFEKTGEYCNQPFSSIPDFETPEMYGARLLSDISERPEHYFARREFPISPQQLEKFELKQSKLAKKIRLEEDKDLWVAHEGSCQTPFTCDFWPLCSQNIEIGPNDIPENFNKREEK